MIFITALGTVNVKEPGTYAVKCLYTYVEKEVHRDANGKPSFGALQERAQLKTPAELTNADRTTPVAFFAFDLLHFAGIDLRKWPYTDRRRYLAQCLLPSPLVQLVHATNDGLALQAAALASGFEGVVGKRKESKYEDRPQRFAHNSVRRICAGGSSAG